MILVDSLLYKIDQKLNKLSTNAHQQIPLEDKILALNEAQIALIKQKVDGFTTVSGMGLDSFRSRYEDLQRFIVEYKKGELSLEEKDSRLNQWSANLTKLNPEYMLYIDSYLIATKGICKDRKIWINKDLTKHGDITVLMRNDNYKPSFEHQETFNTISSDNISIYTDGTFTPTKIFVSYLRYPNYIDKQGYVKFDGSSSVTQNSELDVSMEDELTDLTVRNLATYTENSAATQGSQIRMQTND
jgi:hypothetical protein